MRFSTEKVGTRREFFRAAGRYAVATALAAFAAITAWKRTDPGQRCINLGICRNCGAFSRCELPPALSRRRVLTGG